MLLTLLAGYYVGSKSTERFEGKKNVLVNFFDRDIINHQQAPAEITRFPGDYKNHAQRCPVQEVGTQQMP